MEFLVFLSFHYPFNGRINRNEVFTNVINLSFVFSHFIKVSSTKCTQLNCLLHFLLSWILFCILVLTLNHSKNQSGSGDCTDVARMKVFSIPFGAWCHESGFYSFWNRCQGQAETCMWTRLGMYGKGLGSHHAFWKTKLNCDFHFINLYVN